jgi:WD40 repeat protein
LQGPFNLAGPTNANQVAFSSNGAFAFVGEAANGGSANLTAINTCNNQVSIPAVDLPGDPLIVKVLPGVHIEGRDSTGFPIPDGTHIFVLDSTGFDVLTAVTSAPPDGSICPQTLTFASGHPPNLFQRLELGQGTIQPVNFFASADGTQLYVAVANNSSILVFDFGTGSVASGIELLGNATPVSADISADAGTIAVGGSDGMLHELSTALGGSDQVQLSFPNVPNQVNPFCTSTPAQGPCVLNVVLVKP